MMCKDRQPCKYGPDAIFLSDVVRAGPKGLLPTNGNHLCVHQVPKELPTGGNLVHLEAELLGNGVHSPAGGHAASDALQPVLEIRNGLLGVGSDDGQGVRRGDEEALPGHHVAVGVPICRGPELWDWRRIRGRRRRRIIVELHPVHEGPGVLQVRVGVEAPKVFQRIGIEERVGTGPEVIHEDLPGKRPRDPVHRVKDHAEILPPDQVSQ
mmetsp:Transcript_1844/g.4244  ORF Transcript_1844/g.4244 Transcript_1844/m.4244 type:complete len:210 (+) Transcript_1844:379-1008(+)